MTVATFWGLVSPLDSTSLNIDRRKLLSKEVREGVQKFFEKWGAR
jgi:hypothetical protein